jgi:hypothetical protein
MEYVDPSTIERTEEISRKLMIRRQTLLQMKQNGFGAGELMAAGYKLEELRSVGIVPAEKAPLPTRQPSPRPSPRGSGAGTAAVGLGSAALFLLLLPFGL